MQSTERFSNRVESYRKHRPQYPATIIDLLARECGLSSETQIADVGAGTGLVAEIFLQHGCKVLAIEPNASMRSACESLAKHYPRLQCRGGTAEATGLATQSVDMVTVGQAMHWFDLERARTEFVRILHAGGWCVVVYNHRRIGGDEFHTGYEDILREFGTDYAKVQSQHLREEKLKDFFHPALMYEATFLNLQELDFEGLLGRILSSSYMPQPNHPRYSAMLQAIESLFDRCQRDNHVRMEYSCTVSYAQLR